MNPTRTDRRVARSRRALQEALVALILERGYRPVTVQDVLDRANVGRATFYGHFSSKDALLLSLFETLRDSLRQQLADLTPDTVQRFGQGLGLVRPLFAHAAGHRRLYVALLRSRDGGFLLGHLHSLLAVPMREHLEVVREAIEPPEPVRVEMVVASVVSSTLGVLVWWLNAGLPHSPEEMDRLVERLTGPGVALVLGLGWPHLRTHGCQRDASAAH